MSCAADEPMKSTMPTCRWSLLALAGIVGAICGCESATPPAAAPLPAAHANSPAKDSQRPTSEPSAAEALAQAAVKKPGAGAGAPSPALLSPALASPPATTEANATTSSAKMKTLAESKARAEPRPVPAADTQPTGDAATKEKSPAAPAPRYRMQPPGPDFPFPADEAGKLLAARLSPALPPALSPLSSAAVAQPWPALRNPIPAALLFDIRLPAAEATRPTRVIALEQPVEPPHRQVVDQPPLAFALEPKLPARPALPLSPRANVNGPDPRGVPPLAMLGTQRPSGADPMQDPTAQPLLAWLLAPLPNVRTTPAPPLKVSIPDPLEHLRTLSRRRERTATSDPAPFSTQPLPSRPLP